LMSLMRLQVVDLLRNKIMLLIFAVYLFIYLFIFNKVLNNSHMKVDKFGFFKENTVITRKMWYIYLYFFFMCFIYGYLFFYEFLGFFGFTFLNVKFNLISNGFN